MVKWKAMTKKPSAKKPPKKAANKLTIVNTGKARLKLTPSQIAIQLLESLLDKIVAHQGRIEILEEGHATLRIRDSQKQHAIDGLGANDIHFNKRLTDLEAKGELTTRHISEKDIVALQINHTELGRNL